VPPGSAAAAVGIGAAGPVDVDEGVIHPVNLRGVRGFALRDTVSALVGDALPVVVGHDGGCLALAEAWIGATAGARASMSIVVSTGVGGGFVFGGAPLRGASGNAGHLGQTRSGPATLEERASGPATVAWARERGWRGSTGEELGAAAAAGDRIAREAVERSAALVGGALADAATLLDLDVVAVGGGFSRVCPDYVDLVAAAARATAVLPYAQRLRVVPSGLGDEGPLIGAGALALQS
ncbi:MAG: ROK family protein, partial [Microbacterium sp.]